MDIMNICRCCLTQGCYKDISNEYYFAGHREVYTDMLLDTFGLTILYQGDSVKRLICEDCITKLRDATAFKEQVENAEKAIEQQLSRLGSSTNGLNMNPKNDQDSYDASAFEDFEDRICVDVRDEDFIQSDSVGNETDKGHVFVIKLESKDESLETPLMQVIDEPQGTDTICTVPENRENDEDVIKKIKERINERKLPSVKAQMMKKIENKSKTKKLNAPISKTQIEMKENSLKLILNSNMCLFKSLKTKFRCFNCKEEFLDMKKLREHNETHTNTKHITLRVSRLKGMSYRNVDISDLSCKLCQKPCDSLTDLRDHLTSHGMRFGDGGHFLIPYRIQNGYRCVVCDEHFNNFLRLSIHMNSHYSNNVCEICGVSYINRMSLRLHTSAVHKEKKCSLCPAVFLTNYTRVKHMKKAHNSAASKRYCMLCKQTFRYTYQLDEHKIKDHGDKRRVYSCNECFKTFITQQNLRIHIRCVHKKERNHLCCVCGMGFFTTSDKRRHERTHDDVKSFSCNYCDGKLKTKDSLRRHLKRQHAAQF